MTEKHNDDLSVITGPPVIEFAGSVISRITKIEKILNENKELDGYKIHYGYDNDETDYVGFNKEEIGDNNVSVGDWLIYMYSTDLDSDFRIFSKDFFNTNVLLNYMKNYINVFINKNYLETLNTSEGMSETDGTKNICFGFKTQVLEDKIEGYLVDEQNPQPEEEVT